MKGDRIKPKSNGPRRCLTCDVMFAPRDNRQKYCCVKCRNNSSAGKITTQRYQQSRRAKINEIKIARGCSICGYNEHAAALDFNHVRGDKLFTISQDTKKAWEKMLAEIEKCDVLCANCHRIHTYENRHWHTKRK